MNPSDLDLQLALAEELPELLHIHQYNTTGALEDIVTDIEWVKDDYIVTPREWDWIVREVEKKLTEEQQLDFMLHLCEGTKTHSDLGKWTVCDRLLTAPWQTRAIAYFKTIGKEIK